MTAPRVRSLLTIPLCILGLSCLTGVQSPAAAVSAFEQIRAKISTLAETDCARPLILSVTKSGRPIFGIAITDPYRLTDDKARIVIVSGQHGNEPNSAFATAELALRWANDDAFADLRRGAIVLIIPAANPDGLAHGTRYASSGADPNRDWNRLSLVETSAIARVIDNWKPHLILDEHEWSQTDGYRFDCVELSGTAPDSNLVALGKRIRAESMPAAFAPVDSQQGRNPSLFHRHFLAKGYLTYLIETSPSESLVAKQRLYIQLSAAMSRQAVTHRESIESCSASSQRCQLPREVVAWREPEHLVQKASFGVEAAVGMAAVYCLLLLCGHLRKSSGGWLREGKRAAAHSACVPATPYGMLPELTYRSRASRQSRRIR